MQPEAKRTRDIRKSLQQTFRTDLFIFKAWGNEYQMAGLPDLIGCYRGYFFGIEVKHPETRDNVSARQAYVSGLITAAGGAFRVCCTRSEAIRFIESLDDRDDADS